MLLAAGAATPERIAHGWAAVQVVGHARHGRIGRLVRLGFSSTEAEHALAALHTRNFM